MAISSTVIPAGSVAHSETTGVVPSSHHGASTTVDNTLARYDSTSGALQGYTSTPPTVGDTGAALWPGQPSVLVSGASVANVTGNNTTYTVLFATEIADRGGDFASPTFTAPISGLYSVHARVTLSGMDTAVDDLELLVVASNRSHALADQQQLGAGGSYLYGGSAIVDMDASDTLSITIRVNGEGSNTVDILGHATMNTSLSIWLLG